MTQPQNLRDRKGDQRSGPWYQYPHVWMLIAGPAIVIVAGIATAYIAMRSPDPLVAEDYYRQGIEINKTLANQEKALLPAVQGRNHAATPESNPR